MILLYFWQNIFISLCEIFSIEDSYGQILYSTFSFVLIRVIRLPRRNVVQTGG